jgi:NADH-quinone oxidoreductase subunit D
MSELLLPPEHRYAKIMKERLNEDGRAFDLEFRSYSPRYSRYFPKYLVDGRGTNSRSRTNIGYIHRAFEKIAENRPFTKLLRLQIV